MPAQAKACNASDNYRIFRRRSIMARTRTAGIRIDSDGRRIIDKEHRGVGIYLRLGPISQEDAEQQLANEVARIDAELRYNANHHHRFVDCAERYLAESQSIGDLLIFQLGTCDCSLPISECSKSSKSMTPHLSFLSTIVLRQA
jgi:hypothetical protein